MKKYKNMPALLMTALVFSLAAVAADEKSATTVPEDLVPAEAVVQEDQESGVGVAETEELVERKSWWHRTKLNVANSVLSSRLPRTMNFEKLDLRLRPHYVGLFMEDFKLEENEAFHDLPGYGNRSFIETEELNIKVNPYWFGLGKIALKDVALENLYLQLALDKERGFSIADVFESLQNKGVGGIRVKRLSVDDSTIRFYDATALEGPVDFYINDVDATIRDFTPGREASIEAVAASPGSFEQNIKLNGVLDVDLDDGISGVPLNLDIEVAQAPLTPLFNYLPKAFPLYPIAADANADIKITGNLKDGIKVGGDIDINNLVLSAKAKQTELKPMNLHLDLGPKTIADVLGKKYSFKNVMLNILESKIGFSGSVWGEESGVKWDVAGRADKLKVEDLSLLNPLPMKFLPEDLMVMGSLDAYFMFKGDLDKSILNGNMNFRNIAFRYGDLFAKELGDIVSVVFTGELLPKKGDYALKAQFYLENGMVHFGSVTSLVIEALARKHRLDLYRLAKSLDDGYSRMEKMNGSVGFSGSAKTYGENKTSAFTLKVANLEFHNIRNKKTSGHSAIVDGEINLFTQRLYLKGKFIASEKLTKKLLPKLSGLGYKVEKGRLHIPMELSGHIENPVMKVL